MCGLGSPLVVCSLHALYELRLAREVEVVTPCSGACNHNGLAVEAEGAGFVIYGCLTIHQNSDNFIENMIVNGVPKCLSKDLEV